MELSKIEALGIVVNTMLDSIPCTNTEKWSVLLSLLLTIYRVTIQQGNANDIAILQLAAQKLPELMAAYTEKPPGAILQ